MNDFYTFIVTSTIYCTFGAFSPEQRYEQTLETIQSIRDKVPNAKIIFTDNSSLPLPDDVVENLKSKVDLYLNIDHNIFTRFANNIKSKGIGEAFQWYELIKAIKNNNMVGKRIFKLTGRYKLAEGFNIEEYENPKYEGKYTFRINPWEVSSPTGQWEGNRLVWYFETRLYSFCHTLLDNYTEVLEKVFHTMLTNYGQPMCNFEMCHWHFIPHDKVIEMKPNYVEGLNAENGVYRFE